MTVTEKIKTIDSIIEEYKVQYELDIQTVNISALPSGNVRKYEFLTDRYVLRQKYFLEKAATIKRFEYSPLGKESKAQDDIAKK